MRLIDVDVLPNYEIEGPCDIGGKNIGRRRMRFAFWHDIEKAPTVDAEPVVHSYWIGLAPGPHPGIGYGMCGHCRQRITLGDHKSRCPNCGAIMDQEVPEQMTYKEVLAEILGKNHPALTAKYVGGTYMCPEDAFHGAEKGCCGKHRFQEDSCRDCWNREYQGEEFNSAYWDDEEEEGGENAQQGHETPDATERCPEDLAKDTR